MHLSAFPAQYAGLHDRGETATLSGPFSEAATCGAPGAIRPSDTRSRNTHRGCEVARHKNVRGPQRTRAIS